MEIPLLDLKQQYIDIKQELQKAINDVMESAQFILGPKVREFEEKVCQYTNTKHAIGVGNGTDALVLALKALGIKEGDEVITSPFTFFASSECINQVGAIPVFADIDPETYCITSETIQKKITPKTRAIIPVHIFGHPCDMDEIMQLANRNNIFVVEDACQAFGAKYKGMPVGSIGHISCFSFFPTKNLGGYGDGGIVLTNDDNIANQIRQLRVHGSTKKYIHSMIGYNSRLDEIQAAILNVKIKYIDKWNDKRREKAQYYNEYFKTLNIKLPIEKEYVKNVYHLYIIEVDRRQDFITYMKEKGISTGIYYPCPLHLQEVYKYLGYCLGDLPNTDNASKKTVAIPLYPELGTYQQRHICEAVSDFLEV